MKVLTSRVIALMAVAGSCAGCVFHSDYPKGWAPVQTVASGQCPSIAGRFDNDGQSAHTNYPEWLSSLLSIKEHGSVVELVDDRSGVLRVRVLIPTRTSPVIGEKAIPYTCDEDGLRLVGGYEFHGAAPIATVGKGTLHLTRAGDGSLVARLTRSDAGLLLVLPIVVSEQSWIRFAPETPRQRDP